MIFNSSNGTKHHYRITIPSVIVSMNTGLPYFELRWLDRNVGPTIEQNQIHYRAKYFF